MDDLHRIEVRLGMAGVVQIYVQVETVWPGAAGPDSQHVPAGDPGDSEAKGKLLSSGTAEHGGGFGRCEGAGWSRYRQIYGRIYSLYERVCSYLINVIP